MAPKKLALAAAAPAVQPADASIVDPFIEALLTRYITKGPNAEYRQFEQQLLTAAGYRRRALDIWKFIDDAVTGKGGFSSGNYLFPTKMEYDDRFPFNQSAGSPTTDKFLRRMQQADYDAFAGHVATAPWDLIVSVSDMIERKAKEGSSATPFLEELWRDVDGHGKSMLDFLEYPHGQGRRYGTGYIFIDRPDVELQTKPDDLRPENRPYLYAVASQNVVDWEFDDDDDELIGLVVLEPKDPDEAPGNRVPLRIWTQDSWAVYTPTPGRKKDPKAYVLTDMGPNRLGEIPIVPLWNEIPEPGKMLGTSEMFNVARTAQTVYNIDSEAREIERKCALFLAMPVRNVSDFDGGKAVIGTDSMLLYDGEAGAPQWVSPDLSILGRLDARREKKIESAYEMAHLRALVAGNVIRTTSGFHAEVEFSKTERRIARHAAMLEQVEKRIAILYLKFYGIDAQADPELFSVTYPRDFGVRDMQKLINDVAAIINDMTVGEEWERRELTKLAKARFPRLGEADLQKIVDGAVAARSVAAKQQSALDRVRSMAAAIAKPIVSDTRQRAGLQDTQTGGDNTTGG